MGRIKYLVMDVDGTLTDGKIYMGQNGELAKAFDVKDGCGILFLLPKYEITPVIITARESQILENRCREIQISELHQGVSDKLSKLKQIVGDNLSSVAYAGDDLPDIPCMEAVKHAGGLVICPADAIPEVKILSDYISGYKAGNGAIRDCINYLIQENKNDISSIVRETINLILSGQYSNGFVGGNPYTIQEYNTKEEKECVLESHRNHIDIQYVIEGKEIFKTYMTYGMTGLGVYDEDKDVEFWGDGIISSYSVLVPGSLIVVPCGQPHKGAILLDESRYIKKLVCKIFVD